jgi:hypothetical protein
MRLVYASGLPERQEKALKDALEKAEKKFHIGYVSIQFEFV